MTYKVVIAEDEPIILEGIKRKIRWDELGLELAGTASHGMEAYQLCKRMKPDILITDIRMPELTGLELIKHVKQSNRRLVCIIVSGIGDFHFAREAIELGVSHYLLKPLKENQINDLLREQIALLEEHSIDRRSVMELNEKYKRQEETMRELALSKHITDAVSPADEREIAELFRGRGANRKYAAVVFAIGNIAYPHLHFRAEEEPHLLFGIQNIIQECFRESKLDAIVFKNAFRKREIVALVDAPNKQQAELAKKTSRHALHHISRIFKVSAAAGFSDEAADIGGLRRKYSEAAWACRDRIVCGFGQVYAFRPPGVPAAAGRNEKAISAAEEKMMARWSDERRIDEFGDWLDRKMEAISNGRDGGVYEEWERLCIEVYQCFHVLLSKKGVEDRQMLGDYQSFLENLRNCDSWKEMLSELIRLAGEVSDRCYQGGKLSGEDIVEEVKRHIDRNYAQPISLQWISQNFYIHSNYFCRLFKEKTGVNLTDYIADVRLRQAMKLVRTTDLQIRSIAEMVGYDNPAYFSMLFRKTFGRSPVQVREEERRTAQS